MRVMWRDRYGGPADLRIRKVPIPETGSTDVLLRIEAAALNRSDWEYLTGSPFYARMQTPLKPRTHILGSDVAGEVVAVGSAVHEFSVGERLFADVMYHGYGAFAEYVLLRTGAPTARIPDSLNYSQAAALPQAGTIARQGLGSVKADDHVLLIGGGGATGLFAIQLAKARGAKVTAVDSEAKLELMRGLGADEAVDYRQTDLLDSAGRFDLILDPIAGLDTTTARKLLRPGGTYLIVGGRTRSLLATLLAGMFSKSHDKYLKVLMVQPASSHLAELAQKAASGSLVVPIEAEYPLEELPSAMQRLGDGLAEGRLIITPQPD